MAPPARPGTWQAGLRGAGGARAALLHLHLATRSSALLLLIPPCSVLVAADAGVEGATLYLRLLGPAGAGAEKKLIPATVAAPDAPPAVAAAAAQVRGRRLPVLKTVGWCEVFQADTCLAAGLLHAKLVLGRSCHVHVCSIWGAYIV